MLRVAMHQPNYLPWVGFFDKMKRADLFVIEDHLAFSKGKDCWHARNRIRDKDGWRYLTIPVAKGDEGKPINEVVLEDASFKKQHPRIMQNFYSKAEHYDKYFNGFCDVMLNESKTLAGYNIEIIKWLARQFGIDTKIILSSGMKFDKSLTKTEMIIEILKKCKATRYLSGDGAMDYLDHSMFEKNGIVLEFQGFKTRQYKQSFEGWVPNLSAIDLLLNTGKLDEGVG